MAAQVRLRPEAAAAAMRHSAVALEQAAAAAAADEPTLELAAQAVAADSMGAAAARRDTEQAPGLAAPPGKASSC
jgi:hypothetical protein